LPLADNRGNLFAVVQNGAAVAIEGVQVRVVKYDSKTGRAVSQTRPMAIRGVIEAGKRGQVGIGVRVKDQQEARYYKVAIEAAKLVEQTTTK